MATFHFREKNVSLFISLVIISISRLKLESVLTTATDTMMMMQSFTTFLVLFAAKLSPTTAPRNALLLVQLTVVRCRRRGVVDQCRKATVVARVLELGVN